MSQLKMLYYPPQFMTAQTHFTVKVNILKKADVTNSPLLILQEMVYAVLSEMGISRSAMMMMSWQKAATLTTPLRIKWIGGRMSSNPTTYFFAHRRQLYLLHLRRCHPSHNCYMSSCWRVYENRGHCGCRRQ